MYWTAAGIKKRQRTAEKKDKMVWCDQPPIPYSLTSVARTRGYGDERFDNENSKYIPLFLS